MSGWNPVFGAAFDEARNTGRHDEWSEVTDAAWGVAHHWPAQDEIYYSASSALVALVAYDNCAYLLDEQPDHVQLLAGLGVAGALLLYPACIVLSTEKVPYVKMVPSS